MKKTYKINYKIKVAMWVNRNYNRRRKRMNKQELEEYEMLGEKLICIPSGLKRKDGTDVMSLTLRKWVEEEKE